METRPVIDRQKQMVERLIAQLKENSFRFDLCETHLSWVIIADEFAYKIKKSLKFDFVDYSTLELRHHYCNEELRLNRRLAPAIYLAVIPITGTPTDPVLDYEGAGVAIEYVLKMRAVEQQAFWENRLNKHAVEAGEIDQLANILAKFHESAEVASQELEWGSPGIIRSIALSNLADLSRFADGAEQKDQVLRLQKWNTEQATDLHPVFLLRKNTGFVRECHGDLHRGNIFTVEGEVQVFDCIEFNESLRWIDVINDISFICMELDFYDHSHYAARLLNRYLEQTGDYAGLRLLPYYKTQRALVRSKVAFMKAAQPLRSPSETETAHRQAAAYLAFACDLTRRKKGFIMITHGFSGCGKTTLARAVVGMLGAVQLRSDVERKRMHGYHKPGNEAEILNEGLYHPDRSRQVYERLCVLSRQVLDAGFPVIVDAAFLHRHDRDLFRNLAAELQLPFHVIHIRTDPEVMKARIAERRLHGQDASDATQAVLEYQMAHYDPLSAEETRGLIEVDSDKEWNTEYLARLLRPILD
ncbi:AAA family ATPase [Oxalobacteraceae bacterium R-40]|uniref:AAA family ATPase n=1 Tax=Keguizhuia sedimenti TaxID=3064264 RepID=A0ABU1BQF7_9BURK|nr:AAA family ATPase [Oxalobacteraceae bacterium R-40]